jgi:hypothetical protein
MDQKFAEFLIHNFPRVHIKLNENIKNDEDYENFTNDWLNLYQRRQYYYLIIDTTLTGLINLKYVIKIANFIKWLKNNVNDLYDNQWLQYSIILVRNNFVLQLFNIIFNITKPIAPVFLIYDNSNINIINDECQTLKQSKNIDKLDDIFFKELNEKLKIKNINYKFINNI